MNIKAILSTSFTSNAQLHPYLAKRERNTENFSQVYERQLEIVQNLQNSMNGLDTFMRNNASTDCIK